VDGARIVDIFDVLNKTYGKGDSEGVRKLKSLQPYAPGRRRRFYLAVQIQPPTSTRHYDISLRRNRCCPGQYPETVPQATCLMRLAIFAMVARLQPVALWIDPQD
jgi:hypothetical protein